MKAIRVEKFGGAETLVLADCPKPEPGDGEALVEITASGVNFIDIYQRTGFYPVALPWTPGMEGAGKIVAHGAGCSVEIGTKVAFAGTPAAYAQYVVVPVEKLVTVPDNVDLDVAAAVMLQGMTAHYLAYSTYELKRGDWCVVHAAAGGVGLLLVQMAAKLGAHTIATVSTEAKAALALKAGAHSAIIYTEENVPEAVAKITGGRGVDVVYDSVGKYTFEGSLQSLRRRGLLVSYGQASGAVPPFDIATLNKYGGAYLTRPSLGHYTATREELLMRANAVFSMVASGELDVRIHERIPLADARKAHELLESRATTGKILLKP